MKTIQYSLTFLGTIEVPDNYNEEQIKSVIAIENGFDIDNANDVEYEEI